jgi:hypothetical protein
MNKQKLSEMQYARVRVRPMPLDSSTGQWRHVDDIWIVTNASREELELHNPRTRDTIPLGTDHVREYMTDPGGSQGFLVLKSQICVFARAQAIVEPLPQW